MNKTAVACAITGIISCGIGIFGGYTFAYRKAKREFDEEINFRNEKEKEMHPDIVKDDSLRNGDSVGPTTQEIKDHETDEEINDEVDFSNVENIKDVMYDENAQVKFKEKFGKDFEKKKIENPEREYIMEDVWTISDEEFREPNENKKLQMTYFDFDDIYINTLTENVIPDGENIVGDSSVYIFVGQYEPNVVFVHNDKLKIDVKVIVSEQDYKQYMGEEDD